MQTDPRALEALRVMLRRARAQTLTPPVDLDLPDWADTRRKLSQSAGAVGGQWETSRFEVARGPMLATNEPGVEIITAMVATQTLKTELLLNTIGRQVHLDPCPMLLVQPKDEAVDSFSKERLAPMVRVTPVLNRRMGDARTRRTDDTLRFKRFPGGFLALASAGSPTNLAMRAVRITLLDEIDKYEVTKEGDPVALAEERTSTFKTNRLCIRVCSPTTEENSRIWRSYQDSDQRQAFVPCPHCGDYMVLDFFKHVHWERDGDYHRTETAAIWCEHCGVAWEETQRIRALAGIQWRQTKKFRCCGLDQEPEEWDWDGRVGWALCSQCGRRAVSNQHAGFTASKLHNPMITVPELAKKWIEAEGDIEARQTFYNTQLALPYSAQALKEVPSGTLLARREEWGDRVPDEVLVITAGVDVQPGGSASIGRIELEAVGWGLGEESWSLDHQVFLGDPARPEVWRELDEYLLTPMERQDSRSMVIRAVCVDSGGHNTQDAYAFARARVSRNVWAIKGASDRQNWSPIWPSPNSAKKGGQQRTGYKPVIIGSSAGKEAVRQRLLISEPGPGYCHFPMSRGQDYFDQMVAERLVVERVHGTNIRRWVIPPHRATEAFHIRVYAYAALWGLYITRGMKLDRLAAALSAAPPVAARPIREVGPRVSTLARPEHDPNVGRSRWMS